MMKKTWADPSRYITHLHIEESCIELPLTKNIVSKSGLSYTVVSDRHEPVGIEGEYPDSLTEGKKHLFLCKNRGIYFKSCPATKEYRCCDYQVLNIGMNCPIDCSYCILQAYLNKPWISCYVNIEKMFDEMDEAFRFEPDNHFRIGTGEFTDSLALDRLTGLSKKLVTYMAGKEKGILELKTKSACIDNLEYLDHQGRTVIAWSLNTPKVMKKEELRGASLEERLLAASTCAKWGYRVAFHFDPIIDHPGWEKGYEETIDRIYNLVPKEAIVWISLGCFRYLPNLKEIGTERFRASRIYYQEFIEGLDGKSRYFRTRRVELYRHIYRLLRKKSSNQTCIYFCMESDEIWQEVMGYIPSEKGGLPAMLDATVFNI